MPATERTRVGLAVVALLMLTAGLFYYSVQIRAPWRGALAAGHHQWLSGSTVKFARNWYAEGATTLEFLMLELPRSVEFPTLESRQPYLSYPPGAVIPLYLVSKLRGKEPTPARLMAFNLANHFLVALILALTVLCFLRRLGAGMGGAFGLATIPVLSELLLPGPLYWHQNVYFSDQAVILPFASIVFLEVLRDQAHMRSGRLLLGAAQVCILFLGMLTDWLFAFVSLAVYVKRLVHGELGKTVRAFVWASARFWFPVALALALFACQLVRYNGLDHLARIFLFRAGLDQVGAEYAQPFSAVFWRQYIPTAYGAWAMTLLWGSLALVVLTAMYALMQRVCARPIDPRVSRTASLMGMLLTPCFLQVYAMQNHSAIHDFSTLKFSLPFATLPFVLAPVLVAAFFDIDLTRIGVACRGLVRAESLRGTDRRRQMPVAVVLLVLVAIVYTTREHPRFRELFPQPHPEFAALGEFLHKETEYRDIVFSPTIEIKGAPPQQLAYAMKMVYLADSVASIRQKLDALGDADYVVDIVMPRNEEIAAPDVRELTAAAYDIRETEGYRLYKVSRAEFMRQVEGQRLAWKRVTPGEIGGSGWPSVHGRHE